MKHWFLFQTVCFAGLGIMAMFNNLESIGLILLLGAGISLACISSKDMR